MAEVFGAGSGGAIGLLRGGYRDFAPERELKGGMSPHHHYPNDHSGLETIEKAFSPPSLEQ